VCYPGCPWAPPGWVLNVYTLFRVFAFSAPSTLGVGYSYSKKAFDLRWSSLRRRCGLVVWLPAVRAVVSRRPLGVAVRLVVAARIAVGVAGEP